MNVIKKMSIWYFFLGLFVGMLIMTTIVILFPRIIEEELTKEEIIIRAEKYGMVKFNDTIKENEIKNDFNFEIEKNISNEKLGEKLLKEGYIEDLDLFLEYIKIQYPENKISGNCFNINKDMSIKELCEIFFKESTQKL